MDLALDREVGGLMRPFTFSDRDSSIQYLFVVFSSPPRPQAIGTSTCPSNLCFSVPIRWLRSSVALWKAYSLSLVPYHAAGKSLAAVAPIRPKTKAFQQVFREPLRSTRLDRPEPGDEF